MGVERDIETAVDEELLANGIAVIGMAGRFPGAETLDDFWQDLCAGREAMTRFSREEMLAAGVDPELLDHPDYVPMGRILRDVESFDAALFGFSPREAELLDPQQRLFLECAHEALEAAGYGARAHRGAVGVFAGVTTSTYLLRNLLPNEDLVRNHGQFLLFMQNERDFLSTRVSYKLDLRGPAMTIQTACSTSLVAIHTACQSLLEDGCDLALAGGASIQVPQRSGYLYQKDMIFSPDGRSYAFDARARGTIAGSGVGVVVLKRLEAAIADRDPILAVIRGSAINNDGSAKIGFTAPSIEGQARVIREALAVAGVSADTISHVEAHGTGTPLGDPIEVAALTRVFRGDTECRQFCALGTLKNNIGHTDAAAGVGGLIKTVLMLKHGKIPPSPTFETPNPQIDLAHGPFYVPTRLAEFRTEGEPRRASVSSFGIGGTNAHVVLEEAPALPDSESTNAPQLLTLSGKTPSALRAASTRLGDFLASNPAENLADVAYTLHVGREPYEFRRAVIGHDHRDARDALLHDELAVAVTSGRQVVFQFPGGGTQYPRMAFGLYETHPAFREAFDRCAGIIQRSTGLDIIAELGRHDEPARLERPRLGLSCLFAVEYALATLLMSWGIVPRAMMGHSMGEYVAACLADVLSLEDALLLVTRRGALFETLPAGGAMLSVPLGERELLPLLGQTLAIAAINTPSACTVAGSRADVDRLAERLGREGITCKRLHIDVAAHSPAVDSILHPFRETLRKVKLQPPRIPILSNRSGTWLTNAEATDPEYWVAHLRQTVRYSAGLETALADSNRVLLEVGPGHTLSSLCRQHPAHGGQPVLSTVRHPLAEQSDVEVLLGTIGALWSSGVDIDWSAFHAHEQRRRIALPTYPFERQRFWIDPPKPGQQRQAALARHPARADVADWFYVPSFRQATMPANEKRDPQRIVFLCAEDPLSLPIVATLRARGHEVIVARVGSGFTWTNPSEVSVDPRDPAHYDVLFRSLVEKMGSSYVPDLVVHGFSATRAVSSSRQDVLSAGLYSVLSLTQALDARGWLPKTRVHVLTSGLFCITGEESIQPARAMLLAWLKTAPLEIPGLSCKIVEIHLPAAHVETIATELVIATDEALVAYRGRGRWTLGYERTRLPEAAREGVPIRAGGVYLITGGLGGVGLSIAAAIASRAPVKLVLLGRTPLVPNAIDEDTRDKLRRVEQLERLGAEVLTIAADVGDRAAMSGALAQAKARFGAIHGIVHAAGIPGGGVLLRQTPEAIAKTFSPKVDGTLVLSELFAQEPLDFLVLCSALSTAVGAFGSFDYTAANIFLDAFAQVAAGRDGPLVVAIDWYRWKHLGMAKAVEARHAELTGEQAAGMTEEQGQDAFLRILGSLPRGLAQVLVSPEDLETLLRAAPAPPLVPTEARPRGHERPALASAYVSAKTPTEQRLATMFRDLLGIENVGVHDDFFALGGDSLVGTRLVVHVREALGQQLALRDLFATPTIAGLARRLDTASILREMEVPPVTSPKDTEELEVGAL